MQKKLIISMIMASQFIYGAEKPSSLTNLINRYWNSGFPSNNVSPQIEAQKEAALLRKQFKEHTFMPTSWECHFEDKGDEAVETRKNAETYRVESHLATTYKRAGLPLDSEMQKAWDRQQKERAEASHRGLDAAARQDAEQAKAEARTAEEARIRARNGYMRADHPEEVNYHPIDLE